VFPYPVLPAFYARAKTKFYIRKLSHKQALYLGLADAPLLSKCDSPEFVQNFDALTMQRGKAFRIID
jgi:hypothetical protein